MPQQAGCCTASSSCRHWDTWSDGRRSQLFSLPLDEVAHGDAPVNLTAGIGDVPGKPFGGREDYAFSPDGAQVVFSVRAKEGEPWSTNFDIYEVAADGRNAAQSDRGQSGVGRAAGFLARRHPARLSRHGPPGIRGGSLSSGAAEREVGRKRPLTQDWDRSIVSFAWSRDGKTLFATTDHLGQRPLWAIDAGTGRASAITGSGEVEGFSVGTRKVFYALSDLEAPADLYAVGFAGGAARQLTHVNQAALAQRKFGDYEQFNFLRLEQRECVRLCGQAAGFQARPEIPGGFHRAWRTSRQFRRTPGIGAGMRRAFAGAGYGVVMIDFHGSTGYGQAFTDSISGDWGGKPLEDLKPGWRPLSSKYPWLDGDHVCALGGSYGGYMMNWIAGQWPDRFKCIVSHDGIFDNRSMYYSTEELWFPEWEYRRPGVSKSAAYAKPIRSTTWPVENADAGDPWPARLSSARHPRARRVHCLAAPRNTERTPILSERESLGAEARRQHSMV